MDLDDMVRIAVEAAIKADRATMAQAEGGPPQPTTAPTLELGPQRYSDPAAWRPKTETPLTEDDEYANATELAEALGPPES